MIPDDLPTRNFRIELDPSWNIVLITGSNLRHRRFALRMQEAFGDRVAAWFQVGRWATFGKKRNSLEKIRFALGKARDRFLSRHGKDRIRYYFKEHSLWQSLSLAAGMGLPLVRSQYALYRHRRAIAAAEQSILAGEMARMAAFDRLKPELFEDPNTPDFRERIQSTNPFFLLSLGGPLLGRKILESVRGAAINQHAGWSPLYRGSHTTEWALYHRDLDHVGATVHLTTMGADAGPIFKRSSPALLPEDNPAACFVRVVTVGTELMIETVRELVEQQELPCCDQPADQGFTYLVEMLSGDIIRAIYSDAASGEFSRALKRMEGF
jgi:methionyl-tRNA formyltransferase